MEYISREEFEHFIAEFEVFRDSMLDNITALTQKLELMTEEFVDLEKELKNSNVIQGTSRIR